MRELSKRVNVIPVIAKSDTTSKDELARFKAKILSELRSHAIDIYQFPTDDEAVAEQNRRMNSFMPFAVVGSVDFVTKEDGTVVRARRYPWGMVEGGCSRRASKSCSREQGALRLCVPARVAAARERGLSARAHPGRALRELPKGPAARAEDARRRRGTEHGDGVRVGTFRWHSIIYFYLQRHKEFEEELRRRDEQFNLDFVKRVEDKEADIKRREELVSAGGECSPFLSLQLKIRRRDVEAKYNAEKTSVDQQIAQLHEERARLEGRCSGRDSSKKSRK